MTHGTHATTVRLPNSRTALAVRPRTFDDLAGALASLGLHPPRNVVVLVGGAAGLSEPESQRLSPLLAHGLVPALEELSAVCVDGGTDSGVMSLVGQARANTKAGFSLVGVAVESTVLSPFVTTGAGDGYALEPHHTHFVLVPGEEWGAESPWISRTAAILASGTPSVTVLCNGGDVSYADAHASTEAGRRVIVVAGSGRAADDLAAALAGQPASPRARALAASGLLDVVQIEDPRSLHDAVAHELRTREGHARSRRGAHDGETP